jgi:tocopherol O-methyltransferase
MASQTLANEAPPLAAKHAADSKEVGDGYEIPVPAPFTSFNALKGRIRHHYELCSDYYYSLWYVPRTEQVPHVTNKSPLIHEICTFIKSARLTSSRGEHIHHGYFITSTETKELAQVQLIQLLLARSSLHQGSSVLDVGCGIGGTSRYLAQNHGCQVTGVTISGRQVEMARKITAEAAAALPAAATDSPDLPTAAAVAAVAAEGEFTRLGDGEGAVRFTELDAEKMGDYFGTGGSQQLFDCVWISEAMSHLPNKTLFFQNAQRLLKPGGKLVVAD